MLNLTSFFTDLFAWGIILTSVLVIISVNPVISVIYLILVFFNVAGFLILTGINFIGISYIILYVGAITVLFLFVIMMFNIKLSDIVNTKAQTNAYIAFLIAIIGLYFYEFKKLLPFLVPSIFGVPTIIGNQTDKIILNSNNTIYNDVLNSFNLSNIDIYFLNYLQIETLGEALYTYAAPLLIICSMILLLAMMAPIFISGKFKHNSDNVNNINNDKDNNNDNINN